MKNYDVDSQLIINC